ncbi:MAG TPA: FKBP-type peptidyl-prolyl cis-trans isomerase [Chthoniobacterales bacterium]|jgi:FKBP-type peptidyl-prolyl cis-trans isomerase FklB|nr:FKBP-type peptidyl-prolyl cis-trans isomerase [Chthoniobacterales bacterium]
MKRIRITLVALLVCSAFASYAEDAKPSPSPSGNPATTSTFKDEKDKVSYSLGVDIGRTLQKFQLDLNEAALSQGIADVLDSKPMAMTDQELQTTLQAFQQKMMQKQQEAVSKKQEEMKGVAEKNEADGKKFLDDNAKKPGVKTTASGLQYKVIKEGSGDKPKDTDVVETNYRGTTIDGKEFDSSAKHGSTASFPVNGVIKGWSEALKLMPVGAKWELYVPSDLAYGAEGYGDDIAPGSTLVFEVELLNIKKNAASTPPGPNAQPENGADKKPAGS